MKKNFIGSTIALILGIVLMAESISDTLNLSDQTEMFIAAIMIILGAWSYKSAKKRKLGMVTATRSRLFLEGLAIFLVLAGFFLKKNLLTNIKIHPVTTLLIPLWVIGAYFMIVFKEG